MKKLRFGFLSTANIGRQNWKSIHDSGNSIVAAVASRDIRRSRQFIKELQAETPFETEPAAFGSYEELLASKNVDAVYIPLPTGLRKEWVIRAAKAGKHILCEKPCGVSFVDVKEMADACRKNRVQFMDGVMFMHNPRLDHVRKALTDRTNIGQIKRITSAFSFHMAKKVFDVNVRMNSQLEPDGCLGDLGWYCIRFTLWAMHWRLPREVTGRILLQNGSSHSPAHVPVDFSAELIFDEKTSASFYCSFIAEFQNWVHVSGTKGQLHMNDFIHPAKDHESIFRFNQKEVRVKSKTTQKTNMIRNFSNQVRSGKLNGEWPMWALQTQKVLDACVDSAKNGNRPVSLKQ
jgi:predicted dehydrogenase